MYIMKKETENMTNFDVEVLESVLEEPGIPYHEIQADEGDYYIKLRVTEGYEKRIVMMVFDSYQNLGCVDIVEEVDDNGTISASNEELEDVFSDEVIGLLWEMNEMDLAKELPESDFRHDAD